MEIIQHGKDVYFTNKGNNVSEAIREITNKKLEQARQELIEKISCSCKPLKQVTRNTRAKCRNCIVINKVLGKKKGK